VMPNAQPNSTDTLSVAGRKLDASASVRDVMIRWDPEFTFASRAPLTESVTLDQLVDK
jgi:hypothetical protein